MFMLVSFPEQLFGMVMEVLQFHFLFRHPIMLSTYSHGAEAMQHYSWVVSMLISMTKPAF